MKMAESKLQSMTEELMEHIKSDINDAFGSQRELPNFKDPILHCFHQEFNKFKMAVEIEMLQRRVTSVLDAHIDHYFTSGRLQLDVLYLKGLAVRCVNQTFERFVAEAKLKCKKRKLDSHDSDVCRETKRQRLHVSSRYHSGINADSDIECKLNIEPSINVLPNPATLFDPSKKTSHVRVETDDSVQTHSESSTVAADLPSTSDPIDMVTKSQGNAADKRFACEHCGQKFNYKINMQDHIIRTHRDLPYQCENCFHGFLTVQESLNHQSSCGRHIFKCNACEHIFLDRKSFETHKNSKESRCKGNPNSQNNTCPICSKVFRYNLQLKNHLRGVAHDEELPFECKKCLVKFQSKEEATNCARQCNDKRFECYIGSCKFGKSTIKFGISALRDHMRTHTGIKPFECDISGCGQRFRLKGTLKTHKQSVHGQEKPFFNFK